jgi:hypothetical protein
MGSRKAKATRAARDEGDLSCERTHDAELLVCFVIFLYMPG